MLPYKSGDEVLKELRAASDVPVIILSAKGLTRNKIELLELGEDDYMTKPFDLHERLARIHANIKLPRNIALPQSKALPFGPISMDTSAKVTVNGWQRQKA